MTSRTEAKGFITSGEVTVNGKIITKPSFDVCDDDKISVNSESKKYVSRGGLKLEEALKRFEIDPKCVNELYGISPVLNKIIAVDSGSGQMALSLRNDERVFVIENYNARYMKAEDLPYTPDIAVMDVSFISATLIMPALYNCLGDKQILSV